MFCSVLSRLFTAALLLAPLSHHHEDADFYPSSKLSVGPAQSLEWDPNGYLIFCPCMGRFGNQAEHYLGSLRVAKEINRTLILPPWRSYKNIPFTDWFKLEPVRAYHRVVTAHDFMEFLAPEHWPPEKRIGHCWNFPKNKCEMKAGNPFGPFWDELGIEFAEEQNYRLGNDMDNPQVVREWKERFPPDMHPVVALKGAPAKFPIAASNRNIQRHFVWSDAMEREIEEKFTAERPFVGIHLRNGQDWVNSCNHAGDIPQFFASPQCLSSDQRVTKDLCMPSIEEIVSHTREAVIRVRAKTVYIATDNNPYLDELRAGLQDFDDVVLLHLNPWLPQIDLAVLGRADHFIGNCVSSFTAFVKRERDGQNRTSTFWSFNRPGDVSGK